MSNNLTAEEIGYAIAWAFVGVSLIYWAAITIYQRGYENGWAKGYARGKVIQSERYLD